MRTIDTAERRRRLARRHHLSAPATGVEALAAALVGLHSSDPATVYLSAGARLAGFRVEDLDDALYGRRSLVRLLGMRRTLFVVAREVAAEMDAACTRALAAPERRRLVRMLADQGVGDEAWLRDVCDRTELALAASGPATATELTRVVPELGRSLRFGEGKRWATTVGVSTRVLFLLAAEGRILRARPLGSWLSGRYRWTTLASWLGTTLPAIDAREARASLLRRWLRAFGPGTSTDVKWWTGWTVAQTQTALADVAAVEVSLAKDRTGWLLPDDLEEEAPPPPRAVLLPGLDPTVMGWKERAWYLGEHAGSLFDRNGNAGPTVWWGGRVVGGWAMPAAGRLSVRVLEDVGREARDAIGAEAATLEGWLANVRVTPRFRTPLERELAEG